MKQAFVISFLLPVSFFSSAQVTFKTIVPQEAVTTGESFRVQYVVEGAEKAPAVSAPSFKGFGLVNGPEVYDGHTSYQTNARPLHNTTYTLKAIKPGRYIIPGAVVAINGKTWRSNDATVTVISTEEAASQQQQNGQAEENAAYLAPGEDAYRKINQNLFVKVLVNKRSCYTGEPVVATFKLYSRLQSKSDIVKNPGFYGFTVQDMISLSDKVMTVEQLNGKLFDVHTIRQVQLYPLQAGQFTIDPMEIRNAVEFSRSAVNRKTEQQVTEGVSGNDDRVNGAGTVTFETNINTEPVTIHVKPSPVPAKPVDFNGATGQFSISASVEKNELAKNEEGYLVITIKGKGNFPQLSAPVIEWPAGIEGFEPSVSESTDRSTVPLEGTKIFRYSFVSSKPGNYTLPAIKFSFFDPDTNRYKTIAATPASLLISTEDKTKAIPVAEEKESITAVNKRASLVAAGIVVAFLLIVLIYWVIQKKPKKIVTEEKPVVVYPSVDKVLQPAYLLIPAADKDFYAVVQQAIWKYISPRLSLSGSEMNKQALSQRMAEKNYSPVVLLQVLEHCEAGMFTNAALEENKEALLEKVKTALGEIRD
ncbi:MAG: protein BatD [Chitinophagales bacterium]|nr:protein BatD [Chitinophagales bacterium]